MFAPSAKINIDTENIDVPNCIKNIPDAIPHTTTISLIASSYNNMDNE
jgi:hypothetical protein